ncbi:MAG TPA: hypothetical protein VGS41_11435, partial [Chthonomonadales bacterium]|nr:hypothetical protein [Chthonomonadales bacterium]
RLTQGPAFAGECGWPAEFVQWKSMVGWETGSRKLTISRRRPLRWQAVVLSLRVRRRNVCVAQALNYLEAEARPSAAE